MISPRILLLHEALTGIPYIVHDVVHSLCDADWPRRLEELGFLPGERVMVLRRLFPGGDPLAVRIGHSTFALRRAETACIQVRLDEVRAAVG